MSGVSVPRSSSKYIHQAYATRAIGYLFILAIVIATVYERFEPATHGPILALCLLLPNSLYLFAQFTTAGRATELAEYLDLVFLGLLTTTLHWGMFPLLFVLNGICVSAMLTLGVPFFLRAMVVLLGTVILSAPFTGYQFSINNNLPTAIVCSLGILTYSAALGINAFNQRAYLHRTRRELKEQKEKIEVLASKLSKYLSPQVYRSIFAGEKDVRVESYRTNLTVMFSDIVGFTGIADSMEREQLVIWLNDYFNRMSHIAISQYSGTLDKFIGDSIMVFFGDPHSLGEREDAVQCVKMAVAMLESAREMGIDVRIGIHSGECTVGNFGSDERLEYTIVGGTVNLAARLETSSEPGRILLSDATEALIRGEIPCQPRGSIRVKGIAGEIMTYWVDTPAGRAETVNEAVPAVQAVRG